MNKKNLTTDLLIVGCGIAGLSAAIEGIKDQKVILVNKGEKQSGSTSLAQGGIAAAVDKKDKPRYHFKDSLIAGAGLCNRSNLRILVNEGPKRIEELLKMGARFDQEEGKLSLTKEAAHSKRRILHAGDSTGYEIERALGQYLLQNRKENLIYFEKTYAVKLIISNKKCLGVYLLDKKTGQTFKVLAKNTILAMGGYCQIYQNNTNNEFITGDGIALAYQAGAKVQDMEFVQFHPTTLYQGDRKTISLFLISEAVRGEGGLLYNALRERFMPDYHRLAELAPRDIVSRAIVSEIHKTGTDHVLLDLHQIKNDLRERFPNIYRRCKELKINITKDLIPVAPAAHYCIGGISTNRWGQTSIKHLYAVGECAATGVHGANRLASNSLLEGLVFGIRAAKKTLKNGQKIENIIKEEKNIPSSFFPKKINLKIASSVRDNLKQIMWQNVGIIRDPQDIRIALEKLLKLSENSYDLETNNLLLCALLTTEAALKRKESRGTHYRTDCPKKSFFFKRNIILNQ